MSQLPEDVASAIAELVEFVARRTVELQDERRASGERGRESSPWLSARSAAEYLDWPLQRVYKLTARGEIPYYKQDGRVAFRRDELGRWLERYAEGERK